ncbi:MAG: hypothetical protein EOP53_02970 [Sphingobacteriales bacterium]|nr:MAG: hypothetical protein EOP53_02970 [Sphingobacteriales bacterium]
MCIEVFKTNIDHPSAVSMAIESLQQLWPDCKINIDLHDCDNILRIESFDKVDTMLVSHHLLEMGYFAEVLD